MENQVDYYSNFDMGPQFEQFYFVYLHENHENSASLHIQQNYLDEFQITQYGYEEFSNTDKPYTEMDQSQVSS